jgi:phenylpropionate dioxygenase-like ring-hydroxylating dioxygenase large terminal subunit
MLEMVRENVGELVQERRVHRLLYVDQSIFEREMNSIFGYTWTFLAHESEIPNPNDFVRKRLGLRPIIVTRSGDGVLHAMLNRCSHRGATVCRQDEGNARRFTCPYHNWTFTNTGELVAVPMPGAYGADFDKSELGLGKLRVESYRGFIFGTFDKTLPDLATHLGYATTLLDQWLDRWPGAKTVVRHGANRLVLRGNWKLVFDNCADGYHPGFSHESLLRMRRDRYGAGVDMQWVAGDVDDGRQYVMDLGNGNIFLDQRGEIDDYWKQVAPMPGGDAYESILRKRLGDEKAKAALDVVMGSGMNLSIFPNLLVIGNQIQVIEPYSIDHTELAWYATSIHSPDLPPEVNSLRMRLQEDFPSFGEPDDMTNFEECHLGLGIAESEWVHTGRHIDSGRESVSPSGNPRSVITSELPIRAFWRQWKKMMTASSKAERAA